MKILKEQRAQGSIELLILIGGAITLAAIVGVMLKRAAETAAQGA